jgi:hypothetical protein
MRKTLLIAAAALAASVISSEAQVYSQNIVGYVNTPIPNGFVNIANPLDASDPSGSGVNNAITNSLAVFSGLYDGSLLYLWNGHAYNIFTIDSGQPTGVGNGSDTIAVAPPILGPGVGWFLDNNTGLAQTNTFVGTVHVDKTATGTQVVGQTTNQIPSGFQFYSSSLPVGGGAGTVLQLPVLTGQLDGSLMYIPNIVGGAVHGFTIYTCDSGQLPSGFGNGSDTVEVPEPIIPVGGSFLLDNNTGSATTWVQAL